MNWKFLLLVGAAAVAALLFAVGQTEKASADPYSISFDFQLTDSGTGAVAIGAPDGIIQAGEKPTTISLLKRDINATGGEPYFSNANLVMTGLTAGGGAAITDGDVVGNIVFSIGSNWGGVALYNNIDMTTGQPFRCGTGSVLGTGPAGFTIMDSQLDASLGTVSDKDLVAPTGPDTRQDIKKANCAAGTDNLPDGVTCVPEPLNTYTLPALGLGNPASRDFGIAPVLPSLGVNTDVNFLTWDLTANPFVRANLSVILIGYPGVPSEAPTNDNITEKTVITCPPFSTTVTIYGVSLGNTATDPDIIGGKDVRVATGNGTFRYEVYTSSNDNYDGDVAPDNRDTCRKIPSTGIDVGLADNDLWLGNPRPDNWDNACDPFPLSPDNNNDGLLPAYQIHLPYTADQDVDGDGNLNTVDNCPTIANPTQVDDDQDDVGNACDPAPSIKGDGTGYLIDAHPHGFGGLVQPAGYQDHDEKCSDPFTVPAAEGPLDGSCISVGPDGILNTADDGPAWVDSNDDSQNPDWADLNGNTVYDLGEPIDTRGDADNDKQSDACEAVKGSDPLDASSKPTLPTPPNFDCDGGLALDSWEEAVLNKGAPGGDFLNPADDHVSLDTDLDGCTNIEESMTNWAKGGGRNWNNPRDFYDISNITLVLGAKDRSVSGFDLNVMLAWGGAKHLAGPNANGKDYDVDGNTPLGPPQPNGIADGQELDFASINGWGTGPDGAISGFDLNQMLGNGGSKCTGTP